MNTSQRFKYIAEIDAIITSDPATINANPYNPPSPLFRLFEVLALPIIAASQNAGVSTMISTIVSSPPELHRFPSGLMKHSSDPDDHRYDVLALIPFDTDVRGWDAASAWLYDVIAGLTLPDDVQVVCVRKSSGFQS